MGTPMGSSALEFNGAHVQAPIDSRKVCPTESQVLARSGEIPKWSEEALQAMETHLLLLEGGASRSFASKKRNRDNEGREDPKRVCLSVGGGSAGGDGLGMDRFESDDMGPLVELNSQVPLPEGWEQFLDLRTGQVYYVDWNSLKRSYIDPRKMLQFPFHSFGVDQNCSRWKQRSAEAESEYSECLTDCHGDPVANKRMDEAEGESNWTFPMQEEDWDIMRARGWESSVSDNCSEITSDIVELSLGTDVLSTSSSSEAESEEKADAVMCCDE